MISEVCEAGGPSWQNVSPTRIPAVSLGTMKQVMPGGRLLLFHPGEGDVCIRYRAVGAKRSWCRLRPTRHHPDRS